MIKIMLINPFYVKNNKKYYIFKILIFVRFLQITFAANLIIIF